MEYVYTKSILTVAFTKEGRIILSINGDNKLDTISKAYFGEKVRGIPNYNPENNTSFIETENEYVKLAALAIAIHSPLVVDLRKVDGNAIDIVDCGTLQRKSQLNELAQSDYTCFIRVKPYDNVTNNFINGIQVIDTASFRALVIQDDLSKSAKVRIFTIEELANLLSDNIPMSPTLMWILTSEVFEDIKTLSQGLQTAYSLKNESTLS